jgi:hypothetical protein
MKRNYTYPMWSLRKVSECTVLCAFWRGFSGGRVNVPVRGGPTAQGSGLHSSHYAEKTVKNEGPLVLDLAISGGQVFQILVHRETMLSESYSKMSALPLYIL